LPPTIVRAGATIRLMMVSGTRNNRCTHRHPSYAAYGFVDTAESTHPSSWLRLDVIHARGLAWPG
jgi:hypothetical protein